MKHILLLITTLAALSGCTSSMPDDTKAFGSSDPSGTTSPGPVTTTSMPTDCNQFTNGSFNGKIRAIRDFWGNVSPSSVKVRLSQLPPGFEAGDDVFLEFYVWGYSPGGTMTCSNSLDCTNTNWKPVRFRLEVPLTGQPACPKNTTSSDCYYGYNSGTGVNSGFNRQAINSITGGTQPGQLLNYNIVVTGTDSIYQVIRIVARNTTTNQTVYLDSLIPTFESNPNNYASTHDDRLDMLHPLYGVRGQGWTSSQFFTMTNQYCF
jgi:hypothetical protein